MSNESEADEKIEQYLDDYIRNELRLLRPVSAEERERLKTSRAFAFYGLARSLKEFGRSIKKGL